MNQSLHLKLLGIPDSLLSGDNTAALRDRLCLREDATDDDVQQRATELVEDFYWAALMLSQRRQDGESVTVAGLAKLPEARRKGARVVAAAATLRGAGPDVATAFVGPERGEFILSLQPATEPVVVRIEDDHGLMHTFEPRFIRGDVWMEWSHDGAPPAAPCRYDIEYALIARTLKSAREQASALPELVTNGAASKVALLAGLSVDAVHAHALAARIAQELQIPGSLTYVIARDELRRELPTTISPAVLRSRSSQDAPLSLNTIDAVRERVQRTLLTRPIEELLERGKSAAQAGDLSLPVVDNEHQRTVDSLRRAQCRHVLTRPLDGQPGACSLATLLAEAGVTPSEDLVELESMRAAPAARLAALVKGKLPSKEGEAAEAMLRISSWVGHSLVAIKTAYTAGAREPRDLARDGEDTFRRRHKGVLSDSRVEETVERLHREFPGDMFLAAHPLSVETTSALKELGRDFNLLADPISQSLKEPTKHAKAIAELETYQRLLRTTGDARVAAALASAGVRSAHAVSKLSDEELDRAMERANLSDANRSAARDRVVSQARARKAGALLLYLRHNRSFNAAPRLVDFSPRLSEADDTRLRRADPTYEILFGSPDYCSCEECSSVLSPAAYLVDLLLWLRGKTFDVGGTKRSLLDVLKERRPEIPHILLNCGNAHAEIPRLDLVCELLEARVVESARGAPEFVGLTIDVKKWQTTLPSEQILVYPEHIIAKVYDFLARPERAELSVRLPRDLPFEELRAYLKGIGCSWDEVLGVFNPAAESEQAHATLGISAGQAAAIQNSQPSLAEQQKIWGARVASGTATQGEFHRRVLKPKGDRRQADDYLSPPEFEDLRRLTMPGVKVSLSGDGCSGDQRTLTGLSPSILDLTHRFLRLADAVPWTMKELGALLGRGGTPAQRYANVDRSDVFTHLASAHRVLSGNVGRIDATEYGALFTEFDPGDVGTLEAYFSGDEAQKTLFQRIFLNGLSKSRDKALLEALTAGILRNSLPLTDYRDHLSSVLRLRAEDFEAFLEVLKPTERVLSLTSSWRLYRGAIVSKLLEWPAADYFALTRLGLDGFSNSQQLEELTKTARQWRSLGVAPADWIDWARTTAPDKIIDEFIADRHARVTTAATWLRWDSRAVLSLSELPAVSTMFQGDNPTRTDVAKGLQSLYGVAELLKRCRIPVEEVSQVLSLPFVAELAKGLASEQTGLVRWKDSMEPALEWLELWMASSGNAERKKHLVAYTRAAQAARPLVEAQATLEVLLGLKSGELNELFSTPPKPQVAELNSAPWVRQLREQVRIAKLLGTSRRQVLTWTKAPMNSTLAAQIRNAARGALPEAQWESVSTKVQNELRNARCAALVAYLVGSRSRSGESVTANDLSRELLMDVKDDACARTSRIVEAQTAIQLFVRYCFDGTVEHAAELGPVERKDWLWRGDYRLWEANRRIFLYPENFLRAGSRSSASYQFKEAQSLVRRGRISEESVESAVREYLRGVEEVSNLDYLAVEGDFTATSHVLARSRGGPRVHYYRFTRGGRWSPWEKLPFPISAEHVVLAASSEAVLVAWPTWTQQGETRRDIPTKDESPRPAEVYASLTYASARRGPLGWDTSNDGQRCLPFQLFRLIPTGSLEALVSTASYTGGGAVEVSAHLFLDPPKSGDPWFALLQLLSRPRIGKFVLKAGVSAVVHEWRSAGYPWGVLAGPPGAGAPDLLPGGPLRPALERLEMRDLDARNLPIMYDEVLSGCRTDENRLAGHVAQDVWLAFGPDQGEAAAFVVQALKSPSPFTVAIRRGLRPTETSSFSAAFNDSNRSLLWSVEDGRGWGGESPVHMISGHHPYAEALRRTAERRSLQAMFSPMVQEKPEVALTEAAPLDYRATYQPGTFAAFVDTFGGSERSLLDEISFREGNPYAIYNWELFYHLPIWVADQLGASGRFEEAERYYRHVFNPMPQERPDPSRPQDTSRYWVAKPLRVLARSGGMEDVLEILSGAKPGTESPWKVVEEAPFDPHEVARTRHGVYARYAFMRYLDNLLARADERLSKGGRYNLEFARSLYMKAEDLLGAKPQMYGKSRRRKDYSFEEVSARWDAGGNLLETLENSLPVDFDGAEEQGSVTVDLPELILVGAVGEDDSPLKSLYFCVPPNEKLLGYWPRVAGALEKLRQCRFPQALFEPKIDPQSIADAVSGGLSLEAILGGQAERPLFRFSYLVPKAHSLIAEVRALSSQMKDAIERHDAEKVATLRRSHEAQLTTQTRQARAAQVQQADSEIAALRLSRKTIEARRGHYEKLAQEYMTDLEEAAFGLNIASAVLDAVGLIIDLSSSGVAAVPNFTVGISGIGGSPVATMTTGGESASGVLSKLAHALTRGAGLVDRAANMVSVQAGYQRRATDWSFQAEQANSELEHIDGQIAAAELRKTVASAELAIQELSAQHLVVVDAAMQARFGNESLYEWHAGILRDLHRRAYQLADAACRSVRKAFEFERPDWAVDEIPSEWDGIHAGLAACDELSLWLHKAEQDFIRSAVPRTLVKRDVCLSEVSANALQQLRSPKKATKFPISKWWFWHLDGGLTKRRLKSLSVSIPCVHGPNRAVNALVRLDAGFAQGSTSTSQKAIVLSGGLGDTGGDPSSVTERYGPFEGLDLDADTIWSVEFPDSTDIDTDTISDVVFHFEYEAEPPASFSGVEPGRPEFRVLLDLRRMFPDAWARFAASKGGQDLSVEVRPFLPRYLKGLSPDFKASGCGIFDKEGALLTGLEGKKVDKDSVLIEWKGGPAPFPERAIAIVAFA